MNDVKKTLEYFYKLEFLNPFEPTGLKLYDSRRKENTIFPIPFKDSLQNAKTKIILLYLHKFF